nr:immunoglobulin heavy chain junction region [Mus musculus]NSM09777.1 immunoglobulin heavy chain junction region [Mus musculus]
CARRVGW